MAKRIVLCSDGTGNQAIKGRGTNVFKLFEAVDLNGHRRDPNLTTQVAIYDDGVGTEDFKPLKIIGGALGWGLSRNVKELYKELVRIYDVGDEIYAFGFSRGAFTVRTLVGFIGTCGLVDRGRAENSTFAGLQKSVDDAYKAYRKCYRPWLWRLFGQPTRDAGKTFRMARSLDVDVRVRFLGVWDTVDAVGLPFHSADILNATLYQFKFVDHDLSAIVDRACHALSIDDARQSFAPLVWNEGPDEKRITQVWFAGVHSNVGGGYPKQGMSIVALDWMLAEAARPGEDGRHGLRLNPYEREYFRDHANVDDKLYDPRAGLGIFYRWRIRDIARICREHRVHPKIHLTALERIAHGTDDYAPGNLPSNATVVFTDPGGGGDADSLRRRADAVEEVLRTTPNVQLLNAVRGSMLVGTLSYYVYLVTCLVALVAAAGLSLESVRSAPGASAVTVLKLLGGLITNLPSTLATLVGKPLQHPKTWGAVLIGFGLAYVMMLATDREMDGVFSGFWYKKQPDLRHALQRAKEDAKKAGLPESS
jgi:T6SS, Phospholipase effector Tle1-like, catalytic domain